jgi:hypothetical protein
MGQKRTFRSAIVMPALPPKADIQGRVWNVRHGPIADISAQLFILNFVVAVAAVASPLEAALGYASNVEMVSDPDLGGGVDSPPRCISGDDQ